jgi:hypothetical protein
MSKRYFLGVTTDNDNGFMMCSAGCSCADNQDYVLTTNGLKSDEVPEHCMDAKDFSRLMAGLLNAYYSDIDVSQISPDEVIKMGMSELELDIVPSDQPQLPF